MGTFGDSWKLTKTAFRLIREDHALLAIPAIATGAYAGILLLLGLGFVGLFLFSSISGGTLEALIAVMALVGYFLLWFVGVYFSAALVAAATIRLNGGQPRVADGLAIARANIGKLFLWALFAGTVGLLIQAIAQRFRGLPGLLLTVVAEGTWTVATYFMIPALLYENVGVWKSLKTSASTYIHNFGRTFISNIALGILVALPIIGAVILGIYGAFLLAAGSVALGAGLVVVALAIGIVAVLISMAAEGILTAALYRYAKTGKIEEDLIHPSIVRKPSFATPASSHALPSSSRGG